MWGIAIFVSVICPAEALFFLMWVPLVVFEVGCAGPTAADNGGRALSANKGIQIGGDQSSGDSVALWIAIAALFFYPLVWRPARKILDKRRRAKP